jgi:hypothetical protein
MEHVCVIMHGQDLHATFLFVLMNVHIMEHVLIQDVFVNLVILVMIVVNVG